MHKFKKPEIMAPAGDRLSLMAALQAGADAIYFGTGTFNMRANANNFSLRQLPDVVKIAHEYGAKAYLTLNSLMLPSDIRKLSKTVDAVAKIGLDAIIAWDFAVIEAARRSGINIFISTQMSVANAPAMLFFYRQLGIRRFVLARECSLSDIRAIRRSLRSELGEKAEEIELEVFVHGAMCLSVSGRCQLSQFHFGTSANRGACRQPCRREIAVTETHEGHSFQLGTNYILSPKDLCTLPFLERLLESGVASLKIEGRQRSPEYVSVVTTAYRKVVDLWYERRHTLDFQKQFALLKEEQMSRLHEVFHRGFSSGFYLGRPIDEWSKGNGSQATHRKKHLGEVVKYYKRSGVAEIRLDAGALTVGDEIMIHGPSSGTPCARISSIEIEHRRMEKAEKGMTVGVAFPHQVRCHDKVYRMDPC
ncbi:MAG: U32 family peptidase [Candidatus Riflebacteria bacterium]|nr:U32 family peptidase [Candidatus Riflebacteria bacterium]